MKRFNAPLRLRSLGNDSSRKVTWLELFFDLVFVAAVAQVAAPLHADYSLARVGPLHAAVRADLVGMDRSHASSRRDSTLTTSSNER